MTDRDNDSDAVTAEQISGLAAAAGVAIDTARAEILVAQAAQHFALLRMIPTPPPATEPAVELRLDTWTEVPHA
ncbi:MAG: hypothetical protein U0031_10745 [Thermomicrobiales bacterium]